MLQEEKIKKITEVMQPLVKLNIFTQEEIDALQRVNEPAITMQKKKDETPKKIPELYTLAETAKMLKITIKGVYDLVKSGKLEIIKLGTRTSRISADNILEMLYKSRCGHASPIDAAEEMPKKSV